MAYTLFGSQTSPFVRRLRLLMHSLPLEFKEMNIFETQDAVLLNKINPLNQVPGHDMILNRSMATCICGS